MLVLLRDGAFGLLQEGMQRRGVESFAVGVGIGAAAASMLLGGLRTSPRADRFLAGGACFRLLLDVAYRSKQGVLLVMFHDRYDRYDLFATDP